jgi:ABC-type multidrug transport system permease subunit
MVLALMFSYGALMASVGLVLGSALRNEGVTAAIGVITSNILAALGGCWWPIEITPDWMQKLQVFLPTGLAMDALHKLVSFGAGGASVVPHVLILSLLTLVLIGVSSRIFRYE